MTNEILFRKFDRESLEDWNDCGCCGCGNCDNQDCMAMTEVEWLETMTEEELIFFACETFNVNLPRNHDQEYYVTKIMDLYEG